MHAYEIKYLKRVLLGATGLALLLALFFGGPASHLASAWEANLHQVQKGESFYAIARQYGVDPLELAEHNGMTFETIIHPGWKLAVPESTESEVEVAAASAMPSYEDLSDWPDWQYETLVAVVQQEAGPGKYDSALWVMTTILNRVDGEDWFGNDIWEVVTAPGQFEAYGAEHYTRYLGNLDPVTEQAIQDALNGVRPHDYHFFYTQGYAENLGITGTDVGGNRYFHWQEGIQ